MDFGELTRSRRTVHNYTTGPVDRALVEEALALSLWAPNHRLTYPWIYTIVGAEARAKIADLSVELKSLKGEMSDIKKQATRDKTTTPAYAISLGLRKGDPKTLHEDYATLACSVQIASLYLWKHKIGTKWTTGGGWSHARTYEILGLNPGEVQLEGALLIGIPHVMPPVPERPALAKFLRTVK